MSKSCNCNCLCHKFDKGVEVLGYILMIVFMYENYNVNESINFVKNNFSSWDKVANAEYNAYKNILENKNG